MTRYLVVDDEPELIVTAIKHFLSDTSPIIEVALTGAEGLAKATAFSPDVILLDVQLPDQLGLEIFESLRKCENRAPVIFVTASSTAETAIEAMKLGAFDYLFKPLDFSTFRQIVLQAVELSRLTHSHSHEIEVPNEGRDPDAMIGRCTPMRNVYKSIGFFRSGRSTSCSAR